ncbi:hypothetical protein PLESTB_000605800 [Pleodorina starrii]|uniref:Peptidase S54 rhomboid domain-containing protein n=1 Tax=Pleodorina starrii TaxID=330485 RepID=A0A9W6BHJ4_9CHLO|nr:hypothetical protein PLESTB_000605800 [Pleodorina starrii]
MHGHGGSRPLACRSGGWPGGHWLGRRCRRARQQLERALRGGFGAAGRAPAMGFGAGMLMASAAAGGAAAPAPESGTGSGKRSKSYSDFGHPGRRATDVFLVLNAAVYLLNWLTKDTLLLWGCKINSLIAAGQVWRLLTSCFLHSNPFHLLINMYSLHSLGPQVEMVSGTKRTAVIYLASGVTASLASFFFCPLPSLGASGAVFGLAAALGVFYWRHRDVLGPVSESGLRGLGLTAAINVAYSMANKRIDNFGHLGGILGGALLAGLLGPRFVAVLGEGGIRGLMDLPPVRWLAFKSPAADGASGSASALPLPRQLRRRPPPRPTSSETAAGQQQQQQQQAAQKDAQATQRPSGAGGEDAAGGAAASTAGSG